MPSDFLYPGLFNFGLPLEDIFPPNQIHPSLKLLFERAYVEISKSCLTFPIDSILKGYQGSLDERIALKRRLLTGKLPKSATPTGAWLWLIRHFLGLLPLPLFPKFTDGKFYDWDVLAVACKSCGLKKTADINKNIKRNIANMPKANVILITLLIAFFRKISCYYFFGKQTRVDKYAVIAVVKYFSSSLFLRPYMPGHVTNKDRMYFPLMFYIIYNWPSIDFQLDEEDEINFSTTLLLPVISEEKIYVRKTTISEESVKSDDDEIDVIEDIKEEYVEKEGFTPKDEYVSEGEPTKARETVNITIKPRVQHVAVETEKVNFRDCGCQANLIISENSFANRGGSYTYLGTEKSKSEPLVKPVVRRNRKKVERWVSSEKYHDLDLIYKNNPSPEVENANDTAKCDKITVNNFKTTSVSKTPSEIFEEFCASNKPQPEENHEHSFSSNLRSVSDTALYDDMPLKATTTSSKLLEHETSFYEKFTDLNRTVKDVISRANRKINRKLKSKSPTVVKTKSSANLKVKTSKLEMLKKLGLPISSSSPNVKYKKLMTL